jgi:hypothetical protein
MTKAKMRVEPTTPDSVRRVAERMRDSDVREFTAVSYANDRKELAEIMVGMYGEHPGGMCVWLGDDPVAVGAMVEGRPNVITLLFFATDRMKEIAIPLTRFIKHNVFERYREEGVHRIECVSIDGYTEAHRWIEILGLTREAEFPRYGKGGEKFFHYAWVAP